MKKNPKAESPDYRVLIAPHFNEQKQRYTTRVSLETVKAFASFRYQLNVRESVGARSLAYTIVGLSAPRLNLPASGPASFSTEHENLSGMYTVAVRGLDGKTSTFAVRIGRNSVKLVTPPDGRPIDIVTDERRWSS